MEEMIVSESLDYVILGKKLFRQSLSIFVKPLNEMLIGNINICIKIKKETSIYVVISGYQ